MACTEQKSTSETMNPFWYFGRTPWTGNWPMVYARHCTELCVRSRHLAMITFDKSTLTFTLQIWRKWV